MRAWIHEQVLYLHAEDVPVYKKGGALVRNNYFWALRSIAARSKPYQAWEYEAEVWLALSRMVDFFANSGYLGHSETILEFAATTDIPLPLRAVATWNASAWDTPQAG